jgi:hypothetical protein
MTKPNLKVSFSDYLPIFSLAVAAADPISPDTAWYANNARAAHFALFVLSKFPFRRFE